MKAFYTVFLKEVRENARDRRAVSAALIYGPLIGPVLMAAIMTFMLGKQQERQDKPLEVPVVGAERAPNFVGFLAQQGIKVLPAPDDPEGEIRSQNREVIVRIPNDFAEHWNKGEPAPVEVLFDSSRHQAATSFERTRSLVEYYSRITGALRLQARGINPQVVYPIAVNDRDLSTPQNRAATLMAMLPYFLVLSAFIGGMYIAIDATAGERERQSLEPLLITPVSRAAIVAGKLAATTLYGLASLIICVAAFAVSMRFLPSDALGFEVHVPPAMAVQIAIVIAPVAFLAATLQTVIASYAKSFREAQTYLQFLMLVPALPAMVLAINPVKPDPWMWTTPLFAQSVLINGLSRGDAITAGEIGVSILATLALSLIVALLAVRLYQREQIALGGS